MHAALLPHMVAVIRGGNLHHADSLKTGAVYLSALKHAFDQRDQGIDKNTYAQEGNIGSGTVHGSLDVIKDIYIDRDGTWHMGGFARKPHEALRGVQFVANALHGDYGSDGKLGRLLESFGVRHTNSNSSATSLTSQHDQLKHIYSRHNIRSPRYLIITERDNPKERASFIFNHFHMPVVLIPTHMGRKREPLFASRYDLLPEILEQYIKSYGSFVVEEYINGRSLHASVLESFRNQSLYSPIIVEEKVSPQGRLLTTDTGLDERIKQQIYESAYNAHQTLGLSHISTHHFIVTPTDRVYIVQTDTHPAIHGNSVVGAAFGAVGATPEEIALHISQLALA